MAEYKVYTITVMTRHSCIQPTLYTTCYRQRTAEQTASFTYATNAKSNAIFSLDSSTATACRAGFGVTCAAAGFCVTSVANFGVRSGAAGFDVTDAAGFDVNSVARFRVISAATWFGLTSAAAGLDVTSAADGLDVTSAASFSVTGTTGGWCTTARSPTGSILVFGTTLGHHFFIR